MVRTSSSSRQENLQKLSNVSKLLALFALFSFLGFFSLASGLSEDNQNIEALAKEISKDFGDVSSISVGSPDKQIVVFQEVHDSRAIQIESAIILNRLYTKGLRIIALVSRQLCNVG
jgi:hypothetical protein